MPRREASRTTRCCRTSSAAPSAAVTGALPKTRVRWPSPCRLAASSDSVLPAANTSSIGATAGPRRRPRPAPGRSRPRRPAAPRRSSGCRAGPPSPRGSSARGAARPGRPSGAPGPATGAPPGPRQRSGPVSSHGASFDKVIGLFETFRWVRKTGSVGLSKHLDMPHRPFYLNFARSRSKVSISRHERAGACWAHGRSQPRQTTDWPREAAALDTGRSPWTPGQCLGAASSAWPWAAPPGWRSPPAAAPAPATRAAAGAPAVPPPAGPPTGSSPARPASRSARVPWTGSTRRTPTPRSRRRPSRTTPTRRRSRRPSGPARRPRSSGAGAAAACAATSRPARSRTSPVVRRERRGQGPPVPVLLRGRRRSTARSTRCRPRRSSRSCSTGTRRSSTRSAPSRPSPGATS